MKNLKLTALLLSALFLLTIGITTTSASETSSDTDGAAAEWKTIAEYYANYYDGVVFSN